MHFCFEIAHILTESVFEYLRKSQTKTDNYADLRRAEEFRTKLSVNQLAKIEVLSSKAENLDIYSSKRNKKLLFITAFATDTLLEQKFAVREECERNNQEIKSAS